MYNNIEDPGKWLVQLASDWLIDYDKFCENILNDEKEVSI